MASESNRIQEASSTECANDVSEDKNPKVETVEDVQSIGETTAIASATDTQNARDDWNLVTFLAAAEDATGRKMDFVFTMRFDPSLDTTTKMEDAIRLAASDVFKNRDITWGDALTGVDRRTAEKWGYEPVSAIGPIRVQWDGGVFQNGSETEAEQTDGKKQSRKGGFLNKLFRK